MEPWLRPAIDYIGDFIAFQLDAAQQPGCIIAIVHRGEVVAEHAFGVANLATGEKLTPRHRFRIASHSKAFTAAGIMKLREQRRLRLDDPVGQYVGGLHRQVADTTIAQVLSHSAGLTRDGADSGQFIDSIPYRNKAELLAELQQPTAIAPNTRFKYSNHGYGLAGLVIEAVTGEPYQTWIKREIVDAVGLRETVPNMPLARGTPFARGHSRRLPLRERLVIPGDNSTHAITSAAGFVATAADTARFFAQLAPNVRSSVISVASRREMTRRQWRIEQGVEAWYGLGLSMGRTDGWSWFGHGGGFQGYISRTAVLPECELAISILTNAIDGWAPFWVESCFNILRVFKGRGPPHRRLSDWRGRWWTMWSAIDLVPAGNRVLVAVPHLNNPFMDASEIEVTDRDRGRIAWASGYATHGEAVRRSRDKRRKVTDVWLGGTDFTRESALAATLEKRYGRRKRSAKK